MRLSALLLCLMAPSTTLSTAAQVPAQSNVPATKSPSETSGSIPGNFIDITAKSHVVFTGQASHTSKKYLIETMGSGVALFDYDNDGLLDIFFVNGAPLTDPMDKEAVPQKTGPKYWNRLFHQKKDGTFEDVTEKAGLQGIGYGMGVAVGDYDNDGYEDLYVTAYGGNRLYHNNGNGTFTDVTEKSGTGGNGWSTSATWVDLDNDGLLDLVVLRYLDWKFDDVWCGEHREGYRSYCHPDIFKPIAPLVYHNDGNGHFTEVAAKVGLDKPGKGLGIAIADFDRDGKIDLVVANDSMLEFLYRNKGDGTFEEVGMTAEIAVDSDGRTYAGMGVDFQDYDNDGLPDLIITNLANQKYALYRNNGDSSFSYNSYISGIAGMTLLHSGWGIHFLDYDNDGRKDVLIAQGHDLDTIELNYPQLHYKEPMLLARNTDKGFVDVSAASGDVFHQAWTGRGLAVGDLDNDGRIDAVVTTNGGPTYVLHNETVTSNHWLTLSLVGHRSNRDGIGAVIKLTNSAGSQYVTVTPAGSYLSSSDKRAHFGLGADISANLIEIHWPSGIIQRLENVHGDQILTVDEPAAKQ
jgi:enediyne biosynthesis protein E4